MALSQVTVNAAASGTAEIGTDTVGAVNYQVVKLGFSDAGVAPAQVATDNPLPVSVVAGGAAAGTSAAASTDIVSVTPILALIPGTNRTRVVTAATTNLNVLKSTAGVVLSVVLFNQSSGTRYIKFWDTLNAVTVGTTVPVFYLAIPAGGNLMLHMGAQGGIPFNNGIVFAVTAGTGLDTDTTATAVNDVQGFVLWK
jgi:hypothetical protein